MRKSVFPPLSTWLNFIFPSSSKSRIFTREHIPDDEQLVRTALLRRKQERYTIHDLFNLFDPFDVYFKLSIAMACLLFTPQIFERIIEGLTIVPNSILRFHDCSHNGYGEFRGRTLRNLTSYEEDSNSFIYLQIMAEISSPLISLLFFRTSIRSTLLILSSIGVIKWACVLAKEEYFMNMARIVTSLTATCYRILCFRYIASSVPYNLIVFSFLCIEMTTMIGIFTTAIIIKRTNDWARIQWIPLCIYVLSLFIFYFKAPIPILQTIIEKNSVDLQKLIKKYTKIEKFDADGLIDDVLYKRGNLITDDLTTSIGSYFEKDHLLRQFAYIMYHAVSFILFDIGKSFTVHWLTVDLFSSLVLAGICWSISDIAAAFILNQYHVRKTLLIASFVISIGLLLIFLRHTRSLVNVCERQASYAHTEEYTSVVFFGILCTALGTSIITLANSQMISTFFPVQHQPVLLPIHYFGANLLTAVLGLIAEASHSKNTVQIIECGLILFFLGFVSAFMESEHYWTVVTTSDVLKLKVITTDYPEYPEGDDDTYMDETDAPKRSNRGDQSPHSPRKEKALRMFRGLRKKKIFKQSRSVAKTPIRTREDTNSTTTTTCTLTKTKTITTEGSAEVIGLKPDATQASSPQRSETTGNTRSRASAEITAGTTTASTEVITTETCSTEDEEDRYSDSLKAVRQVSNS